MWNVDLSMPSHWFKFIQGRFIVPATATGVRVMVGLDAHVRADGRLVFPGCIFRAKILGNRNVACVPAEYRRAYPMQTDASSLQPKEHDHELHLVCSALRV